MSAYRRRNGKQNAEDFKGIINDAPTQRDMTSEGESNEA